MWKDLFARGKFGILTEKYGVIFPLLISRIDFNFPREVLKDGCVILKKNGMLEYGTLIVSIIKDRIELFMEQVIKMGTYGYCKTSNFI